MSRQLDLTPHARTALIAAGLKREEVEARIPDGSRLMGSAWNGNSRGPFRFVLLDTRTGDTTNATAHGWSGVAAALDELLGAAVR